DSSEFTGKFTQEEEEEQVAGFMMQDDGASLFDDLLNSNVTENTGNDLFGEICSAVSNDASAVTESDISLFDNEQAY
ncbi:hypothetical protein QIG11_27240, partial [Klebsiella pneumoniae]|nr:hypothetical protein [Klebsiella pneumoniae]